MLESGCFLYIVLISSIVHVNFGRKQQEMEHDLPCAPMGKHPVGNTFRALAAAVLCESLIK
jgi:hypothetical protein